MKDPIIKNELPFGVYFHIPFCAEICHYCDFAKTALYSEKDVSSYFRSLNEHLRVWLGKFEGPLKFGSIYFGGGTPGLFSKEYCDLFNSFKPRLSSGAEITLEVNPPNITKENLAAWKGLGFNRLSIGIQSFQDRGLKFLTRDHSPSEATERTQLAKEFFSNTNIDLIYGWKDQTLKEWLDDLENLIGLNTSHLSLYCLTYSQKTTIGRRINRGVLKPQSDAKLAKFYECACEKLRDAGYEHEEISNWAKPSFKSVHNLLYWRGNYYIGIGAGAHGFVPDEKPYGLRYFYPDRMKAFLNAGPSGIIIDERDTQSWLLEYIGCGLRCEHGVDLELAQEISGKKFVPNRKIEKAFDEGILFKTSPSVLLLSEKEWFRETAWSVEVADSFRA